jgi:hypothetical protein
VVPPSTGERPAQLGAAGQVDEHFVEQFEAATLEGVRDTPGGDVTDNGSPLDSVTIHDAFLTQRKGVGSPAAGCAIPLRGPAGVTAGGRQSPEPTSG